MFSKVMKLLYAFIVLRIASLKSVHLVSPISFSVDSVKSLSLRIGELIRNLPLIKKKVKYQNLVITCCHSSSFDSLSVLIKASQIFVLELQESLYL